MPPINILIKPASSACNAACAYCFYHDVAQKRKNAFEGMLSLERMEQVIRAGLEQAEHICSFTFQGGEPTLRGLEFYREVVRLQRMYARPSVEIQNNLQTNGLLIDADWAEFFHDNAFLIGLSLDGPAELHDANRFDHTGHGTWSRAMGAARLFRRYGVDFNVLSVVTGRSARAVERIYNFYRRENFRWLQFIPCMEPLGEQRGTKDYYLSPEAYGEFLIRLFDLWYVDLQRGEYRSIRQFDNWMFMMLGQPPEACNMRGTCNIQFVIEGDGGVYPCDFYVLDRWRLGTVGERSLAELQSSERAKRFVEYSCTLPEACRSCQWLQLCRNGCRRDREVLLDGTTGKNYYCQAYQSFFRARTGQMEQALKQLLCMRRGNVWGGRNYSNPRD